MKRLINLKRPEARRVYGTYALVTLAYVILQIMISTRTLSSSMRGMLVPICAYMVMAVALNLVVGVLSELRRRTPASCPWARSRASPAPSCCKISCLSRRCACPFPWRQGRRPRRWPVF